MRCEDIDEDQIYIETTISTFIQTLFSSVYARAEYISKTNIINSFLN